MNEDLDIRFSANGRSLALTVRGRSLPDAKDESDRNSLTLVVAADTGNFSGCVGTVMWLDELENLKNILVYLSEKVGQEVKAEFSSIEAVLSVEFSMSRLGGLTLDVEIHYGSLLENCFAFVIAADQSYLPLWLEQITHILAHLDQ